MEVTENNGGELGIKDKLWQHDKVHQNSSKTDQDKEENITAAQARTREKFWHVVHLQVVTKKIWQSHQRFRK